MSVKVTEEIPCELSGQRVLAIEVPHRKRRVLVECKCGSSRWIYWFVFKKTPARQCKECAYKARRTAQVRFTTGDRVGQCTILEVLPNRGGGIQYRVKHNYCGHVRVIVDSKHQRFKGERCSLCSIGKCKNSGGYVDWYWYMPDGRRVTVKEHRIIMEQLLGRELLAHEEVHHLNGIRDDNSPENLELWSISQPPGQRVIDKIAWAKQLLALYEPEALA